ncbi:hypothetical protein [Spiroplasma endosymbiont of Clivina fossor]|uniref:hypothetical protein n=1 Tax=Spiroplasma endosymbiont of Clivina fossor TaxID=3066282 RepID=UPI00313D9C58
MNNSKQGLVALLAAISISITPALNISNITNKLVNKNYANDSERDKRQIQLYSGMIAKNIQTQLTIMKNEKNIVAERIVKYNLVAKTIKILEDKIKKHLNGVAKEDIEFIKEQIDKLNTANEALELLQLEFSDFAINFTHVDYWRIYSRLSQDIESRNVWIKHLQNQYVDSNNNLSDVQNAIIRIKIIKNQITV